MPDRQIVAGLDRPGARARPRQDLDFRLSPSYGQAAGVGAPAEGANVGRTWGTDHGASGPEVLADSASEHVPGHRDCAGRLRGDIWDSDRLAAEGGLDQSSCWFGSLRLAAEGGLDQSSCWFGSRQAGAHARPGLDAAPAYAPGQLRAGRGSHARDRTPRERQPSLRAHRRRPQPSCHARTGAGTAAEARQGAAKPRRRVLDRRQQGRGQWPGASRSQPRGPGPVAGRGAVLHPSPVKAKGSIPPRFTARPRSTTSAQQCGFGVNETTIAQSTVNPSLLVAGANTYYDNSGNCQDSARRGLLLLRRGPALALRGDAGPSVPVLGRSRSHLRPGRAGVRVLRSSSSTAATTRMGRIGVEVSADGVNWSRNTTLDSSNADLRDRQAEHHRGSESGQPHFGRVAVAWTEFHGQQRRLPGGLHRRRRRQLAHERLVGQLHQPRVRQRHLCGVRRQRRPDGRLGRLQRRRQLHVRGAFHQRRCQLDRTSGCPDHDDAVRSRGPSRTPRPTAC